MDSLYSAFDTYLHLVYSKTKGLRTRPQPREGLTVFLNPERELRGIVESLEEGAEFKELVLRTRPAFEELARQTRKEFPEDFYPDKPDSAWSKCDAPKVVKNFFRRSGAYSQCIGESNVDVANLFAMFENALKQTPMIVRFLAPLESVSFYRNLNCGSFSIKRFSQEELDEILKTAVNRIFYTAADTKMLCRYWFLVAEERQSVLGSRTTGSYASYSHVFTLDDLITDDVVCASYQPPLAPIKRALEVLSLFDWEHKAKEWSHFRLPFVILTDDALLRAPCGVPDCSRLDKKKRVHLEETASSQLENFSRDIDATLIEYPSGHPWNFFEIAIKYFGRAFQTEGLDQILWYWIAIEALLGTMPVQTIYKRLARMLGSTESEQKQIKKRLDELYTLRCHMVHGNNFLDDSRPAKDLAYIRQIARQAILWFARWLNHVRRTAYPDGDPSVLPSRSQLLSVIDFDKHSRQNIGSLLSSLPPEFPNVSTWSECNPLPIVKTKKEVV